MKLSVVIPLYNKAASVARALSSVLAQTTQPIEIIVVNDGSTDDSETIVKQFADKGVRLITQDNQGVSAARNRGSLAAKGDYIAFLDADDYWLDSHLESICALFERWPDAVLASTAHHIKRFDQLYTPRSRLPKGWIGVIENFFKAYANDLGLVNSSTACVKRQVLLAQGGFPENVGRGEDVITWCQLSMAGRVVHHSIVTAVYTKDGGNQSSIMHQPTLPGSLIYLAQLQRSALISHALAGDIGRLFDRIALLTAADFYLNGDVHNARRIAGLAMQTNRWKTGVGIRMTLLMPLTVLKFVKERRHMRATT